MDERTGTSMNAKRATRRPQSSRSCSRASSVALRRAHAWHRAGRRPRSDTAARTWRRGPRGLGRCGQWLAAFAALLPALAAAGSPFATGANATQQQLVAILTPLAAVAVMVSGAMAWFGRLSWWWMVAVVIGTVLVFGGPQIVSWIRGLFGV